MSPGRASVFAHTARPRHRRRSGDSRRTIHPGNCRSLPRAMDGIGTDCTRDNGSKRAADAGDGAVEIVGRDLLRLERQIGLGVSTASRQQAKRFAGATVVHIPGSAQCSRAEFALSGRKPAASLQSTAVPVRRGHFAKPAWTQVSRSSAGRHPHLRPFDPPGGETTMPIDFTLTKTTARAADVSPVASARTALSGRRRRNPPSRHACGGRFAATRPFYEQVVKAEPSRAG